MKSQLSCILFALIVLPAGCGGDRSTAPSSKASAPIAAVAPPAVAPAPVEPAVKPGLVIIEPPAPTTYSETLAQGKAAAAAGDRDHARMLFEAAAKLDRKAADPQLGLARLAIAGGERGKAIAAANKAVKLSPSSQAYNTLGRAELLRFNYDAAIAAFARATELDPGNVWAWNNRGLAELQQQHYQAAADALVEATRHPGTEGYMWNNLGTAYEQTGQLDLARDAFDHGGQLGSKEAIASRKRLEGVKTVAVAAAKPAATDTGYDLAEPMPEPAAAPPEPPAVATDDADAPAEPDTPDPVDAAPL